MEDVVALAVTVEGGMDRYFLTWGRIQDRVDPPELEALILEVSVRFSLGAKPISARVCSTLHEAQSGPHFYEGFFSMCQLHIPYGERYEQWRAEMDQEMRKGKQIYYLGNPTE
jgi:hypothetical protein